MLFVFIREEFFDWFHVLCPESIDSKFSNLSVFNYFWTVNCKVWCSCWSSVTDPFIIWISLSYNFPWPPPDFVWMIKKELHNSFHSSAGFFLVPVFIPVFHHFERMFNFCDWVHKVEKLLIYSVYSDIEVSFVFFYTYPFSVCVFTGYCCGKTSCSKI